MTELDATPALHEIPILLDADDEPAPVRLTVDRAKLADGFGIFSRDEVRELLVKTMRLGLKGIAFYRDGSLLDQPQHALAAPPS